MTDQEILKEEFDAAIKILDNASTAEKLTSDDLETLMITLERLRDSSETNALRKKDFHTGTMLAMIHGFVANPNFTPGMDYDAMIVQADIIADKLGKHLKFKP